MPDGSAERNNPPAALHRPVFPEGRAARQRPSDAPCPERDRPYVLVATILASAMAFIDSTVVTIALPALQDDLSASFSALQWVVNAYALLLGGLILIGGGAGDRYGRKRIFLIGIVVFALSSLGCAIAPNVETLILARAGKGIGAALLVPQSLAIIAAAFPKDVRGRAIGIWAGASAITTAMGPPIGGFLIDVLDWRVVFWINLPLSAIAILVTLRHVPESRNRSVDGPLDWPGGVLAVLGFGALTLGLTLISEAQDMLLYAGAALVAGLAALIGFLAVESRTPNPLVPLALFRDRSFTSANFMTLFLYGALYGIMFLLPFDLIERRGFTATEVGLVSLPIGIIIGVFSKLAGGAADRNGPRPFLVAGSLLVAGSAVLLGANLDDFRFGVIAPVLMLAFGMAMVVAPLTTAVMNAAADDNAGAASGVNNAASRLAGLFAVAILGSVASIVFSGAIGDGPGTGGTRFGVIPEDGNALRPAVETAFLSAYSAALWVAALWSGLAALIALLFLGPRARDRLHPAGRP
ncbi:MAG: MFS transporter [Pseudomonadota bacterium]